MAVTVATTINRFKRGCPDCSDKEALDYLNEVHADLCTKLPIKVDTEDISLTADTQEYALDEDIIRVWSGEYFKTSTDRRNLYATEVTELNIKSPNWRRTVKSTPTKFYIWRNTTGMVVGFYPKPDTTTSSGYPKVTLYVTRVETLTSSSSLPQGIQSADTYINGMKYRYAQDKKLKDELPLYDKLWRDSLTEEVQASFGRNVQSPVSFIPGWLPRGGVV